jgi:hypothetical protein
LRSSVNVTCFIVGLNVQNTVILHVRTRRLFDCVRLVQRQFAYAPWCHRYLHLP